MPVIYKIDILQKLRERGYTSAKLRKDKLLAEGVMQSLRESKPISWSNISRICELLECQPGDILEYVIPYTFMIKIYYVDDCETFDFDFDITKNEKELIDQHLEQCKQFRSIDLSKFDDLKDLDRRIKEQIKIEAIDNFDIDNPYDYISEATDIRVIVPLWD